MSEFTKYAVACGGPSKPLPPGVKLASDGKCPHCGDVHASSAAAPTSSGGSTSSTPSDSESPPSEE